MITNVVSANVAQMVITTEDNAYVIYKKEVLADGRTYVTEVTSPNPEILEYVPNTIDCFASGELTSTCLIRVRLKKDGPINLVPYDTSFIPYGYASVDTVANTATINLDLWGSNNFHISDLVTQATDSPAIRGNFSTASPAEGAKYDETDEYIEVRVLLRLSAVEPGKTTQFETYQVLASGIPFPEGEIVLWDDELLAPGYAQVDGNKGRISAMEAGSFYAFISDYWNQSPGHYAALRFFINGDNEQADGLNITGFTEVEITLNCLDGLVVEAFLGAGMDSSQTFLGDIVCDGFLNTYNFSVPTADLTDIQTGVWLHIPTWKNSSVNEFRVYMNVDRVTLNQP